MKALVIFESMYGNTARVARAIGDGLRDAGLRVDLSPIDAADEHRIGEADLLVLGGPTHMHGMSRPTTRSGAAKDPKNTYDHPTVTPGIRTWLDELPEGNGRSAVAFDTRFAGSVLLTGSAAKGIARGFVRRGFRMALPPTSFFVTKDNTLVDGELERARDWGAAYLLSLSSVAR